MRNLTCIVCPIGCSLDIEENGDMNEAQINVTGNHCARGAAYAHEEIRAPKRVVTATAAAAESREGEARQTDAAKAEFFASIRRIPVKTSAPCLREKIPALLDDIYKLEVSLPVKAGDVVIADWNSEGIDVIATRTVNI